MSQDVINQCRRTRDDLSSIEYFMAFSFFHTCTIMIVGPNPTDWVFYRVTLRRFFLSTHLHHDRRPQRHTDVQVYALVVDGPSCVVLARTPRRRVRHGAQPLKVHVHALLGQHLRTQQNPHKNNTSQTHTTSTVFSMVFQDRFVSEPSRTEQNRIESNRIEYLNRTHSNRTESLNRTDSNL